MSMDNRTTGLQDYRTADGSRQGQSEQTGEHRGDARELSTFFLYRLDQAVQTAKCSLDTVLKGHSFRVGQKPQAMGKVNEILCLRKGTTRDIKKMQIVSFGFPRRAFRNVRRYRVGSTPELAG